jgi:hypothetical protein
LATGVQYIQRSSFAFRGTDVPTRKSKKSGKKLQAGKALPKVKSLRLAANHNEVVLR